MGATAPRDTGDTKAGSSQGRGYRILAAVGVVLTVLGAASPLLLRVLAQFRLQQFVSLTSDGTLGTASWSTPVIGTSYGGDAPDSKDTGIPVTFHVANITNAIDVLEHGARPEIQEVPYHMRKYRFKEGVDSSLGESYVEWTNRDVYRATEEEQARLNAEWVYSPNVGFASQLETLEGTISLMAANDAARVDVPMVTWEDTNRGVLPTGVLQDVYIPMLWAGLKLPFVLEWFHGWVDTAYAADVGRMANETVWASRMLDGNFDADAVPVRDSRLMLPEPPGSLHLLPGLEWAGAVDRMHPDVLLALFDNTGSTGLEFTTSEGGQLWVGVAIGVVLDPSNTELLTNTTADFVEAFAHIDPMLAALDPTTGIPARATKHVLQVIDWVLHGFDESRETEAGSMAQEATEHIAMEIESRLDTVVLPDHGHMSVLASQLGQNAVTLAGALLDDTVALLIGFSNGGHGTGTFADNVTDSFNVCNVPTMFGSIPLSLYDILNTHTLLPAPVELSCVMATPVEAGDYAYTGREPRRTGTRLGAALMREVLTSVTTGAGLFDSIAQNSIAVALGIVLELAPGTHNARLFFVAAEASVRDLPGLADKIDEVGELWETVLENKDSMSGMADPVAAYSAAYQGSLTADAAMHAACAQKLADLGLPNLGNCFALHDVASWLDALAHRISYKGQLVSLYMGNTEAPGGNINGVDETNMATGPISKMTVGELLLDGFPDSVIALLNGTIDSFIRSWEDKDAWAALDPPTDGITVWSGASNPDLTNTMKAFRGVPSRNDWTGGTRVNVAGSYGGQHFPPGTISDDVSDATPTQGLWVDEAVRTMTLSKQGAADGPGGHFDELARYRPDLTQPFPRYEADDLDNTPLCMATRRQHPGYKLLFYGWSDAPLVAYSSYWGHPQFLGCPDDVIANTPLGMSGNEDNHESYYHVDPVSGYTIEGKHRLGEYIVIEASDWYPTIGAWMTGDSTRTILPRVWIEDDVSIHAGLKKELEELYDGFDALTGVTISLLAIGLTCMCAGLWFAGLNNKCRERKYGKVVSPTSSPPAEAASSQGSGGNDDDDALVQDVIRQATVNQVNPIGSERPSQWFA